MVNFTNHFFHTEYMPDVDKLQLAFTVGSFIYPKKIISSYAYDKQYIKSKCFYFTELKEFFKDQTTNNHHLKDRIIEALTDDFYGLLSDKELGQKRMLAIEVYRYFFRFSLEKIDKMINNKYFLVMILQYI